MEPTVWIVALALAAVAGLSCKDSTPSYISFDAQASAPAVDAKPDAPPKTDAGSPSDAVDSTSDDDGGTGQ